MLTGCGTYSRYHRPDLSMENLYSTLPADADTTTLASLSWREMFTDPKLQSLIETGLDRNTDLNVARLRVEAAASALLTAKLSYLPSLGLNAEDVQFPACCRSCIICLCRCSIVLAGITFGIQSE